MKLGFLLGYSGKHIHIPLDLIKQANASVSLEFLSHSEPEETKEFVDNEKRNEYEDILPKTKTSNSGTTM